MVIQKIYYHFQNVTGLRSALLSLIEQIISVTVFKTTLYTNIKEAFVVHLQEHFFLRTLNMLYTFIDTF